LVAYHATFEKNIIARLTGFCSTEQAAVLKQANSNFVDLLPLMRNHVYHPQFRGRFNLKRVVQALLPDHSYDDLAVKRGDDASRLLEFLLLGNGPSDDTDMEEIRDALLAYCERDTLVLLKLEALLRKMASQT